MGDPTTTTIRLTDADKRNVEKIMKTGIATNTSEAIRVALTVAPQFLALWNALMAAKVENITESLVKLQDDLRRDREEQAVPDFSKTFINLDELRAASPTGQIPKWVQEYFDRTAESRQALRDIIVPPSGRRASSDITVAPSTGRRR